MKNLRKLLFILTVYLFIVKFDSFANRRSWSGLSLSHTAGVIVDMSGKLSNSYAASLLNDLEFGINITKNFYLGGEFEIQNLSLLSFWPGLHVAYTNNKFLIGLGTTYLATGIKGLFRYSVNNRLALESKLTYFWPLVGETFLRKNVLTKNHLNLTLGINFKLF